MPRRLQPFHPLQAGAGRQAHAAGQLDVRDPAVHLQFGQDLEVDTIELGKTGHAAPPSRRPERLLMGLDEARHAGEVEIHVRRLF